MNMATKESYHIPYGLAQSYADMTISLNSKDGTVGKVLPMAVVMTYIVSFLGCMFCVTKTFIGKMGSIPQIVVFCILWAILTVILASYDGTRRMNMQRIMPLLNYLPKKARQIYTRNGRDAGPFWGVAGMDDIADDGMVTFSDGTYGYWYRVVGSASILLFDSDRDAILNRVDNFYRKWGHEAELLFMTCKESQKVYRQVASLQRRYQNLKTADPDLRELAEEQFRILKDYIGTEFKSIHQYMLVKAQGKEALRIANSIVQSEVENSSLMIKQCVPLDKTDVLEMLKSVYQKSEGVRKRGFNQKKSS